MFNKGQTQDAEENAIAIQAGGDINLTVGVTASEARNIALDVAKSTFYELSGVAREIANVRVTEITDQVIKRLEKDFPAGLQKANDPDFQYALFTVQKEYARTGSKELGDLLVNLLVDRSRSDQRDLLQIVLNESLATAPKLTENQLAILSLTFLLTCTRQNSIKNHEDLGSYIDNFVLAFSSKIKTSHASYQHLEFLGCGSVLLGNPLEKILGDSYTGLFKKGFFDTDISHLNNEFTSQFFMPCLNDNSKLQVKGINKTEIENFLNSENVTPEDKLHILNLFDSEKMSDAEVKAKVIAIRPQMEEIFDTWNNTSMQHINLTSVGMALGHANMERIVGKFGDLSIWIH